MKESASHGCPRKLIVLSLPNAAAASWRDGAERRWSVFVSLVLGLCPSRRAAGSGPGWGGLLGARQVPLPASPLLRRSSCGLTSRRENHFSPDRVRGRVSEAVPAVRPPVPAPPGTHYLHTRWNFLSETFFSLWTAARKSAAGWSSSERISPSEWAPLVPPAPRQVSCILLKRRWSW